MTLEEGTRVADSVLSHTLVGTNGRISNSTLTRSMLGTDVTVDGFRGSATLGDHSELRQG